MKFSTSLSKETVVCSELKVKDYKNILKCSYGETPDQLPFIETLCETLAVVSDKPIPYIRSLNIIDLFCLLIDARVNCLGKICKIVLTLNNVKHNIELNLANLKTELSVIFLDTPLTIQQDEFVFVLDYPSAERLLNLSENDIYLSLLKKVYIQKGEVKYELDITTNKQAETFINLIPPSVYVCLVKNCNILINKLLNVNFLDRYNIRKDQVLNFNLSIDTLIWYTKLIFNESLEKLYNNIFNLSYLGHMSAEYIENSVVGEYIYFAGCLAKSLAEKNPTENQA